MPVTLNGKARIPERVTFRWLRDDLLRLAEDLKAKGLIEVG